MQSLSLAHVFDRSHLQLSQNGSFTCRTVDSDQASVAGLLCRLVCGQQGAERPDFKHPGEGLSIVSRHWPMTGEQTVWLLVLAVQHVWWGEVPPFSNSKKRSQARCFFGRFCKSGADIFGCLVFEMRKWAFSNALRNGLMFFFCLFLLCVV